MQHEARKILQRRVVRGEIVQPDIKYYYKITVLKTVRYQHKKRQMTGTE